MIRAFEKQQLLYMRCEHCSEAITEQQTSDVYREYVQPAEGGD